MKKPHHKGRAGAQACGFRTRPLLKKFEGELIAGLAVLLPLLEQ